MKKSTIPGFASMFNAIELKIFEQGYVYADKKWHYKNVQSSFNRLYLVNKGHAQVRGKKDRVSLDGNGIYLIPLNKNYDYCCDNSMEKFYIHFRLEVSGAYDVFESPGKICWRKIDAEKMNEYMLALVNNDRDDKLAWLTGVKGLLFEIIAPFISGKYSDYLERISRYAPIYSLISENLSAEINVSRLAKIMNMSLSSLSKNFKKDTGIGLKEYISNKLIQKASDLLIFTDMKIRETARSLGFMDEFYFSRFFTKHTGMPPREYRRIHSAMKGDEFRETEIVRGINKVTQS